MNRRTNCHVSYLNCHQSLNRYVNCPSCRHSLNCFANCLSHCYSLSCYVNCLNCPNCYVQKKMMMTTNCANVQCLYCLGGCILTKHPTHDGLPSCFLMPPCCFPDVHRHLHCRLHLYCHRYSPNHVSVADDVWHCHVPESCRHSIQS